MRERVPPPAAAPEDDEVDSDRSSMRWIYGIFLVCLIGGFLFLRAPETILSPTLLFDDGQKVFAYFYEHRGAIEIVRFKSGYLPLIGNLIGYLSVRLPTRWIPYGMAGSAFLISLATYSLFFARPFRRWVPSDFQRALICLLFALAPVSDCFLLTVSDYSLWNLLVVLILLTAMPPPKKAGWKYLHLTLCNVLVWSHPLSLVILPLVIWRALRDREHRFFYRLLLFNLVVHQIFGVAGILTMRGLWDTRGVPSVSLIHKLLLSSWWTVQLVPSIAFRAAFGEPVFEQAITKALWLVVCWAAVVVAGASYVFRRLSRLRPLLLYLAYLIVALTFLSCFLRYQNVQGDPFAFIRSARRYIYVQSLSFLIIYAVLLSAVFELRLAAREPLRKTPDAGRYDSLWLSIPLVLLLVHYFYLNTQFGYFSVSENANRGPYNSPNPANGVIVRRFFTQLAELETRQGSRKGVHLEAPKRKDWPIVVDTTKPPSTKLLRFTHRSRVVICLIVFGLLAYTTRNVWLDSLYLLVRRRKETRRGTGIRQ